MGSKCQLTWQVWPFVMSGICFDISSLRPQQIHFPSHMQHTISPPSIWIKKVTWPLVSTRDRDMRFIYYQTSWSTWKIQSGDLSYLLSRWPLIRNCLLPQDLARQPLSILPAHHGATPSLSRVYISCKSQSRRSFNNNTTNIKTATHDGTSNPICLPISVVQYKINGTT